MHRQDMRSFFTFLAKKRVKLLFVKREQKEHSYTLYNCSMYFHLMYTVYTVYNPPIHYTLLDVVTSVCVCVCESDWLEAHTLVFACIEIASLNPLLHNMQTCTDFFFFRSHFFFCSSFSPSLCLSLSLFCICHVNPML